MDLSPDSFWTDARIGALSPPVIRTLRAEVSSPSPTQQVYPANSQESTEAPPSTCSLAAHSSDPPSSLPSTLPYPPGEDQVHRRCDNACAAPASIGYWQDVPSSQPEQEQISPTLAIQHPTQILEAARRAQKYSCSSALSSFLLDAGTPSDHDNNLKEMDPAPDLEPYQRCQHLGRTGNPYVLLQFGACAACCPRFTGCTQLDDLSAAARVV